MDELDSSENEDSEKFNFGSVHNNDQFKFSYEYTHENIPQVDGLDNLDINKNIFSVNCELEELLVMMNFFLLCPIYMEVNNTAYPLHL